MSKPTIEKVNSEEISVTDYRNQTVILKHREVESLARFVRNREDRHMSMIREPYHPAQVLAAEATERARKRTWTNRLRGAWAAGSTLPKDSAERKEFPVHAGVVRYCPAALVAMAAVSKAGNDKHNPGQPLHHARSKSTDQEDCQMRHMIDAEDPTCDRLEELACKAWRACIELQIYAESLGAPMAPGAKE
jgi:hypothetical protein